MTLEDAGGEIGIEATAVVLDGEEELVASPRGNKLAPTDVAKFNAQYGGLTVKTSRRFHDRFLIIDDRRLY